MTDSNDPKLDAITKSLRERPLEDRVPGRGQGGMSAWEKAELLALLGDED